MPLVRRIASLKVGRLHENEFEIDDALVRRLVDSQFSGWRELPLRRVASSGTVHVIFRLGDDLAVRLPRAPEFSPALEREVSVLPILRTQLPVPIPELVAVGAPTRRYPSLWSVVGWIYGVPATQEAFADPEAAAGRLGSFVGALWTIEAPGERSPNRRGRPLAESDEWTRASIAAVSDEFDPVELTSVWESALAAPPWDEATRWIHGDLLPGNLLVRDGRLAAIIDFGECARGNPTVDLVAGWWVFEAASRDAFRETCGADQDSWNRARGWALSGGVGALAYYRESNPEFADQARHTLRRVVDDGSPRPR